MEVERSLEGLVKRDARTYVGRVRVQIKGVVDRGVDDAQVDRAVRRARRDVVLAAGCGGRVGLERNLGVDVAVRMFMVE